MGARSNKTSEHEGWNGCISSGKNRAAECRIYLCDGLLHLCLTEGRKCRLQILHNALKAVTLHYLPLMTAQQTEGHFKDHLGPLDK